MPIKVESHTDYFVDTEIEEVAQLAKKELRKHHPFSTSSERYIVGGQGVGKSGSYSRMTSYWPQPKISGRGYSDYVPVNLVTSVDEINNNLVELKIKIEEVSQKLPVIEAQIGELKELLQPLVKTVRSLTEEDFSWLNLIESSFAFWDNEEDSVYDDL